MFDKLLSHVSYEVRILFVGRFDTTPFQDAGFVTPKLKFALRNPLLIGEKAQQVAQEGAQNHLDGVLRSSIEVSRKELNLVDGILVQIDKGRENCCYTALKESLKEIPDRKFALIFINDSQIKGNLFEINEVFKKMSREEPVVLEKGYDTVVLQEWLSVPEKRSRDICILGSQHRCNGIETELVVYVYPVDCEKCKKSDADPVIISRAKAKLILSTYHRLNCDYCGFFLIPPDLDGPDEGTTENETSQLIDDKSTQKDISRKNNILKILLTIWSLLITLYWIILFPTFCSTHSWFCPLKGEFYFS